MKMPRPISSGADALMAMAWIWIGLGWAALFVAAYCAYKHLLDGLVCAHVFASGLLTITLGVVLRCIACVAEMVLIHVRNSWRKPTT